MITRKNRVAQRVAMLVLAAVVFLGTLSSPLEARKIEDEDITLAVERKLFSNPSVPSHYIDVNTDEGIVTLLGPVDNTLARGRATEIAETIKGVRSVVNTITVELSLARTRRSGKMWSGPSLTTRQRIHMKSRSR